MSRLDDAARSVPADPSTADDEAQDNDLDLDLDANAAGDADDSEDQPDEKSERSIENVRGELLRKMQKSNEELLTEIRELKAEKSQYGAPQMPASTPATPQTLDDLSLDELKAMRTNVPEEQRAAFDTYVEDRRVDERVDQRLNKFQSTTQFKNDEAKYNKMAFDRWPELHKKGSEFYQVVDRILSEMPNSDKNARAVYDAANDAGIELGRQPSGARATRTRPGTGRIAPGRTTRGTSGGDEPALPLSEASESRLAQAMPGGKFSEKAKKRIAKNSKLYKESIGAFVRG